MLRLSKAANRLQLRSLGQVSASLNRFLWKTKLENEAWKGVWADLEELIVSG